MSLLFEEFKTICFHLNRVGITPTLMGSLGLEFRTKENWEPSDIDIHVPGDPRGWEAPDHLRIYDWDKIMKVMKDLGYVLIDIHEHEFQKDRVSVEFGSIDSLPDFAGVSESDIELIHISLTNLHTPHAQSSGTYPRVARTVPRSFVFLTAKLNHLLAPSSWTCV